MADILYFFQERGAGTTFIATQDPIPTEDGDFWPMVWEQDVRVIIRLSSDKDFSDSGKQARVRKEQEQEKWLEEQLLLVRL